MQKIPADMVKTTNVHKLASFNFLWKWRFSESGRIFLQVCLMLVPYQESELIIHVRLYVKK